MTLVSKDEFRSALSEFATGVTVITTLDNDGEPHSMTANAFTSVCLDPPIILVCIAHGTHTYGYVENRERFGVNFLNRDQQELGAYFAKKPEDRTGDVKYSFSKSNEGFPVLDDCIVFFECDVVGSHVYGDHTIFLAEVKEIRRNESDAPLMFYKSRWYNPAKD